jgi:endonuclease/exonuclease/phosphatase family metal-dependent hydrolase
MRTPTLLLCLLLPGILSISACDDKKDDIIDSPVTIANLNVLHGFDCDPPTPADGDQCRIRNRVALLADFLIDEGCPDLVTLQEIVDREFVQRSPTEAAGPLDSLVALIEAELTNLASACGFTYHMVYQPFLAATISETDEEMILTRYPVLHQETQIFHSALYDEPAGLLIFARHVLYARIDHPTGAVDVYTTHLASGSDSATNDCDSFSELVPGTGIGPRVACPAECDSNDTVRACQAEQLAMYVDSTRDTDKLAFITGDFNALPGTSEYLSMTDRGWLDSHLSAGEAECDSDTGAGCTSGRSSSAQSLEDPALAVRRRIDYIFVALPDSNSRCSAFGETPQQTPSGIYRFGRAGIFAGEPNPFAESCGSEPADICWVSDHSGNYAAMICQR